VRRGEERVRMIRLRRVYEKPAKEDGIRVLVDRLWPRGFKRGAAAVDVWMKDVAPTKELRKWFCHDPEKWEEFQERYWAELEEKGDRVETLKKLCQRGTVTLLYASRDEEHNNAVALKAFLERGKR
jgi:uncharacterized protein YeaO (DUF488 family)